MQQVQSMAYQTSSKVKKKQRQTDKKDKKCPVRLTEVQMIKSNRKLVKNTLKHPGTATSISSTATSFHFLRVFILPGHQQA